MVRVIMQAAYLVFMIVCATAAPVLSKPAAPAIDLGIFPIVMCPIPMCMAMQGPCDNIQISFIMMGDRKCPMCQYCASSLPFL